MLNKKILDLIYKDKKEFDQEEAQFKNKKTKFDKKFQEIEKKHLEFSKKINSDINRYLK